MEKTTLSILEIYLVCVTQISIYFMQLRWSVLTWYMLHVVFSNLNPLFLFSVFFFFAAIILISYSYYLYHLEIILYIKTFKQINR